MRSGVDAPASIAASIYIGIVGSAVFIVLPILLGTLAAQAGLSDRQIGQLAAAQMLGMFAASLAAVALIPRCGWQRPAYLSAIVLGACHVGSAAAGPLALLALQGAAGFCGGLLIAVSMSHLGNTAAPDRNFALWVSAQIALGVAGTYGLPRAAAAGGAGAMFVALAVLALSTTLFVRRLGADGRRERTALAAAWRGSTRAGVLSLLAAFSFAVGIMAVWPFLERIARHQGLAGDSVSAVVGLTLLAGLGGALLAARLADRRGRALPLTAALAAMLLLVPLLGAVTGERDFAVVALLFAALWNFSVPYQLATTAANDRAGTLIVLYVSAVKGGYAVAPLIASPFLDGRGYRPLFWISATGLAVSLALYLVAHHLGERRTPIAAQAP